MTSKRGWARAGRALAAAVVLAALPRPAAAQFIPYYGKNKVTYETFTWRIYKSPHFEAFYYPEFEQHLGRIMSYAESAYLKISGDLKHELEHPVPLILYKTHSDFEQTNLYPDEVPEGVLAFAEPIRQRMVMPIDLPPDLLQGLITHELTHIFEFELVPRSLIRRDVPLWVDEGLADYERGIWDPLDLMTVRDAAVTEQVPPLSRLETMQGFANPRVVYNLGHAAFEYIESRYGKEGIRQFLYTLRKNVMGGGVEDIYQQAFRTRPEDFDEAFEKWLKERFKPFRDRQRPGDYGKNLAPNEEKTSFTQVFAWSPSPSGEMLAAITGNRSEGEADVVLLSANDGSVIKNLTSGFTGEWEGLSLSESFVAGRSIGFDPHGDRVAFFARHGKRRTLFLISALSGRILRRIPMTLDQTEGPCLMPDGRHLLMSALQEGISDIYELDLETGRARNLTQDAFADADPQVSPDGTLVTYTRRVSGHEKVYVFPLARPEEKTQLTFGTFDDVTPSFSPDGNRIYYSSTEDDDIYNLRSIDLRTGVIRQYSDVLGGNTAPAVLVQKGADRLGFISYFKGSYGLHTVDTTEALKEVDQQVEGISAQLVDFQPDVMHQVITENKRRKKVLEGLYLAARPPLNVGVTSGGDFYGGTQVALSDVLEDHSILATFISVQQYRSYDGTYINLSRRLHWGASFFDYKQFFYSTYLLQQTSYITRNDAFATSHYTGATAIAQYPLDRYRRLEASVGGLRVHEAYEDPYAQQLAQEQAAALGIPFALRDGYTFPLTLGFVQETTRFREWGPLAGSTVALSATFAPGVGSSLAHTTFQLDARKYLHLGPSVVFAGRFKGFHSFGDYPDIYYFGGNMEMRGYDYYSFSGNTGFFANLELRLPIIDLMKTPIGILGPLRGTLFGNIGGAHYKGEPYTFWTTGDYNSYVKDPIFGTPASGRHLVDGRASYGIGLQFFFLGYPLHFDFSKLTDLQVVSNGSRFDFWIGFDF